MADGPTDVPWPEEWPRRSSRAVLGAIAGFPLGAMMIGGGVATMDRNPPLALGLAALGWLLAMCAVVLPMAQPGSPGRAREHVRAYEAGSTRGVLIPASRPVRYGRRALFAPLAAAAPVSLFLPWPPGAVFWREGVAVAVLLAAGWLVRACVRARPRQCPEGLLLRPDGLVVQRPLRMRFVPWSRLLGFTEFFDDQGSQWQVVMLEHEGRHGAAGQRAGERTRMRDRQIVANTLGVDPALIPSALRFYLDNPQHRAELASDAGVRRIRTADFALDADERERSRQQRDEELAAVLPAGSRTPAPTEEEAPAPTEGEAPPATGSEAPRAGVPHTLERPRAWRMWSPTALWGLWALQVVVLLAGAVATFGYAMGARGPGATVGVGAGMPVTLPASAVLLLPVATAVLVLIRGERIRCAEVTTLGDRTTVRPSRRLRGPAWLAIAVLGLGSIGPLALLADFWTTGGPAAAAAFGWVAGCGFLAWPTLSGLRKVLRGLRSDDLLQVSGRELVWRARGYERRVPTSDVLSIVPSVGGVGEDPCIRVGVAGAGEPLVIPWRFLTAGPMLVLRTLQFGTLPMSRM